MSLAAVCLSGPYKNCSQKFHVRGSIDSHLLKTLHCDWKLLGPGRWHVAVRAKTNKEVNGLPPLKKASSLSRWGGGGTLGKSWRGTLCHPVLQILTLFQTKNVISFHTPFHTWPLRNHVIIEQLMKEMKSFLILFKPYETSLKERFSSLMVEITLDPIPSPTPTPSGDLWSQNWCKSWSMIPWTFFDPWIQSGVD